ncbi:hypothetical protein D3C72_532390 [compost metagenome]
MHAGRRGQHGEDRRVRVVEADRTDGVEAAQVVLVRHVVAVPGDHVQWRVLQFAGPMFAQELLHQLHRAIGLFVVRHRGEEVARVGQAVAANRAQVRDAQRRAVVFGDVAAGLAVEQFDAELHATRDYRDFQRLDFHHPQLGGKAQAALLRHQQQFTVGVEEHPLHGTVGAVDVDAHAGRFFRSGVGHHGQPALDEIGRFDGDRLGVPAQAVRGDGPQRAGQRLTRQALETRVQGRRTNTIQPGAAQLAAGHGERRAREQLGIQPIGRLLRRVLPDRQGPWQRFAGKLVAEAAEVVKVG